jgi:hypothetical protein
MGPSMSTCRAFNNIVITMSLEHFVTTILVRIVATIILDITVAFVALHFYSLSWSAEVIVRDMA